MTNSPLLPPTTTEIGAADERRAELLQAQIMTLSFILRVALDGLATKSERERGELLKRIRTETSREISRFAKDPATVMIATSLMNATVPRR